MTRTMKILIAALGLSLAANLFVAGYWLGGWPGRGHHRHHAGAMTLGQPSFATLRVMSTHLTPAQKDMLRERLRGIKAAKKQQIDAMHAAMKDIDRQLRAPDIDRDELLASYEALRAMGDGARQPFLTLMADMLAGMDAGQRRAFLDDLAAQRRAHWRRPPDMAGDQPPR